MGLQGGGFVAQAAALCRACDGSTDPRFQKRGFSFVTCRECGVISVADPLPDTVDYDASYFSESSVNGYAAYVADRDLIEANFAARLVWLQSFTAGGRLLDVGAAYGFFVHLAARAGFAAQGLEPAADCAAFARRELGAELQTGRFESVDLPDESFDVVTMFDVLEHFENPRVALQQAARLLRPGGLLVVETGDTEALLARLAQQRWYFFDPPQHLVFFSQANLAQLARSVGFGDALGVGHIGRQVSLRNFSFQLSRALGGRRGALLRRFGESTWGQSRFRVPDRGNAFIMAFRREPRPESSLR